MPNPIPLQLAILKLRGAIERYKDEASHKNDKYKPLNLRRAMIEMELCVEECYRGIVAETPCASDKWNNKEIGSLSKRRAIIALAKQRKTARDIAAGLGMSYGSVAHILAKLRRTGEVPRLTERRTA